MKIFKYEIPIQGDFDLKMPDLSKILSFQVQRNTPMLWAIVNPGNNIVTRHFKIVGTGQELNYNPDSMDYIGTVLTEDGNLVWHLFELSSFFER